MIQRRYEVRPSFGSALVGMVVAALLLYGLFRLASWTVATLIAGLPIFFGVGLLLAAIAYAVDRRVVLNFGQWVGTTFERNALKGVGLAALAVLFAPFVCGYLLAKALLLRRVSAAFTEAQERMADAVRQQARRSGGGAAIGSDADDAAAYEEVRRGDGLVIRIPREEH